MQNGQIISFEIINPKFRKLAKLYSKTFGWQVLPSDGKLAYHGVITGKNSLFGAVGDTLPKAQKTSWLAIDLYVDNLQKTITQFLKSGGTLILPKFTTDTGFTIAYVCDPEGNVFGLVEHMPKNYNFSQR